MTDSDVDPLVDPQAALWVDMQLRDSAPEVADHQDQKSPASENGPLWTSSAIWTIGLLGFGLPSLVMNPSFTTLVRFAFLIVAIPAAFMFFGPYWDQVLFEKTPYSEIGKYLFLATCCCVPLLSVWLGFRDRRRLQVELTGSTTNMLETTGATDKPVNS